MSERELGTRKLEVLRAVVEEFVRSGEPVGSETIAEHARLGVSSATIRNELAALEELGYLSHPHTSAGRIPTDAGYRKYVDALPPGGRMRDTQRRAIAGFFAETMLDLEDVLKGTTQLLSRVTQYASVAVPPSGSSEVVVRTELIELGSGLLLLVVGQRGGVDKVMIDRPDELDADSLAALERSLTDRVRDKTVSEARAEALKAAAGAGEAERRIFAAALRVSARASEIVLSLTRSASDRSNAASASASSSSGRSIITLSTCPRWPTTSSRSPLPSSISSVRATSSVEPEGGTATLAYCVTRDRSWVVPFRTSSRSSIVSAKKPAMARRWVSRIRPPGGKASTYLR